MNMRVHIMSDIKTRAVSRKLSRQVATDCEWAVPGRGGFPGLRDTEPTGCQLRMAPDHRHGWRALAASSTARCG